MGNALLDQTLHDEGLEQLQRHILGQAALIQLELRADDDNGTAGIVHALAQQVLAEAALLTAQQVGQALEGTIAGARYGAAAAAVIDQRVHSLLQHALFIADDDVRRAQLQHALEAVIAVDHAAIQIVQVGWWRSGRRPAAPWGADSGGITGTTSRIIHSGLLPLWRKASTTSRRLMARVRFWPSLSRSFSFSIRVSDFSLQLGAERVQIQLLQHFLDSLGADARAEGAALLLAAWP